MAQTKHGSWMVAAKRIGISYVCYRNLVNAGFKWCWKCRNWLELTDFGIDNSRYDKQKSSCFECSRVSKYKQMKLRRPSITQGNRASEAVRKAVKSGLLPPVKTKICKCGQQARHYHHYKGYNKKNFLNVLPMCMSCHRKEHWNGRY